MKRRKRFSIRLVALGLAITAIAAPAAQAVSSDPDTNRVESGLYYSAIDNQVTSPDDRKMHATWSPQRVDTVISSPDDRKMHATWEQQRVDTVISSPDDRKMHATWEPQPIQTVADSDDGFGTDSIVGGLVLLLVGSFGIAVVVRTVKNGRLAPT